MTKKDLIKQAKEISADEKISMKSVDFLEKQLGKTEYALDLAFEKGKIKQIELLESQFISLIGKCGVEADIAEKIQLRIKQFRKRAKKAGFRLN